MLFSRETGTTHMAAIVSKAQDNAVCVRLCVHVCAQCTRALAVAGLGQGGAGGKAWEHF